jgi:hypothetical protein
MSAKKPFFINPQITDPQVRGAYSPIANPQLFMIYPHIATSQIFTKQSTTLSQNSIKSRLFKMIIISVNFADHPPLLF